MSKNRYVIHVYPNGYAGPIVVSRRLRTYHRARRLAARIKARGVDAQVWYWGKV